MTKPKTSSAPSGVLVVDKSTGPTSHDVVALARRALDTKAVGHTGTLDPMATGALIVVVGEATKLVTLLGGESKLYRTTIRLGVATHTLDAQGEVTDERSVPPLTEALVNATLSRFVGEIAQVPPNVSAIKVDGQSAHQRARRGEDFALDARTVRLDAFTLHALREHEIDVSLRCGKGFYVRALARDLAHALGTVAHLTALRREENAGFAARDGCGFERLRHAAKVEPARRPEIVDALVPFAEVCRRLPHVHVAAEGVVHLRVGRPCPLALVSAPPLEHTDVIALDEHGTPVAIVRAHEGALRVARGLNA